MKRKESRSGRHGFRPAAAVAVLLMGFTLFLAVAPAAAQSPATLTGVVTDPSGAALANAEVTAERRDAAAEIARTRTDAEGRYSLLLPPGTYRVRIAPGGAEFLAAVEREITLAPGESRQWNERLSLERLAATVVVTAHAVPLLTRDTPSSVAVLPRTEIERRQELWLAPALAGIAGIATTYSRRNGGIVSIFVNGGNSNFARVLVDGVPLNEPGGNVELSAFSLENVEKVEVVRGAESALFGSDAMTGVVQVFTRRGTTSRPRLGLLAEGGNFGTVRGAADFSGVLGRFDYSLAAARFHSDGQEANDVFRLTTLSGNFGFAFSPRNSLRLTLRSASSHMGVPGQTVFTPPNLDQQNAQRNFLAGLAWQFSTTEKWEHRLSVTETYLRQNSENPTSDYCDPSPPFFCDFPFSSRNQYNRATFGGQSSYLGSEISWTLGWQYGIENGSLTGRHVRRNYQGGYVEARWQPSAARGRLLLTAGARAEANDNFGTRVVPRAAAVLLLRQGGGFWGASRLRASAGLGVKEPTFFQSYGFSTDPCFPGNPALRPERSRTVQVGFEQRLADDRVRVSAEGFFNRFRDIVSFTFCLPGGPCPVPPAPGCSFGYGTFFNTDLARARGVNLTAEAKIHRWVSLSGTYSFTDSRVLEAPNAFDPALVPGERLLRRPVHAGNIYLGLSAGRFSGSLAGQFVGPRTDSDFLGLGLRRNASYVRFDLAASVALRDGVTAFGRIENLFDREYQEVLGYRAFRRAYRAGMKFTLGPAN